MKPLFDGGEPKQRRADMGDMPIANCKYNCETCDLKTEGCTFKVNTLNCMTANKRMEKIKSEMLDKKVDDEENEEDKTLLEEQQKSITDLFASAPIEGSEEDKDDEEEDD